MVVMVTGLQNRKLIANQLLAMGYLPGNGTAELLFLIKRKKLEEIIKS